MSVSHFSTCELLRDIASKFFPTLRSLRPHDFAEKQSEFKPGNFSVK